MLPGIFGSVLVTVAAGGTVQLQTAHEPSCSLGSQRACCIGEKARRIAQLRNASSAAECCSACSGEPQCGAY
eukprot:SAG31_NODE_25964_length_451_cov_0.531250_1_plen_71_part_01